MTVVGIDGCKSGWIAVALTERRPVTTHFLARVQALDAVVPDAEVVAIDVPIGLPDIGRREADLAAWRFLGPRRNSVFFTPVRSALLAANHSQASAIARRETGAGISRQVFALKGKILEVEEWLPSASCPVFEVHPEVSFAILLGGPARAPKRTWAGMVERRNGLAAAGIDLEHLDGPATTAAAVDDMLDAAVAAWTARRIQCGAARSFPDTARLEAKMAIWA